MPNEGSARRSGPASGLLVGLTLLTVPAVVVAFLAALAEAEGPALGLPVVVFRAAALVAGPLALALFAASALELRRQRRSRAALLRAHHTTLGELAAIVETADDAIIALDGRGIVTRWNLGAERLFAAPADTALGRPFAGFVPADGAEASERTLGAVLAGGVRIRTEAPYRRSDGSRFDGSAAWSPLEDPPGHVVGASLIVRDVTRSNEATARIARSERRRSLVTGNAIDAIVTADEQGTIVEWNAAASRIFGHDEAAAIGRALADLIERPQSDPTRAEAPTSPGSAPGGGAITLDMLRRLAGRTVEVRGVRASGRTFPAELSVAVYEDEGRTWYTAFVRDASPRVEAERRAREAAARYQDLVEHVPGVVYRARVGRGAPVEYVSPHIEALTGYTAQEWTERAGLWESIVHPDDLARFLAEEGRVGMGSSGIEYRLVRRDGRVIWVRDHAGLVKDEEGDWTVWSGLLVDVTERKGLEAQLMRQAFHDPLTGLANRALFADRMEHALKRTEREPGLVGLVMLDLDNFKTVNDTLGHDTGDLLLKAVSTRLRQHVRAGCTVARLGGDEFAVLVEDLDDEEGAMAIAHRIVRAFDKPFKVGTSTLITRASAGVVVDSMRRRSADWMMRSADVAMYEAKRNGKGRWQLYDPASYLAATKRAVLESELRRAVERKQFVLLYQPIVNLASGRIIGAEALVRWQHPGRGGLVPPGEFISILETTGLIVELGDWALQTACLQASDWAARHPAFVSMAVNASARQIADPSIVSSVTSAVAAASIDPRLLLVEVTESVALDAPTGSADRLRDLRAHGVRVAIDDFGTGYSSLAYLRNLPVDTLKIDRTFIEGVGDDEEATAVARAIVTLAGTLRLQSVAEGIETAVQAAAVRALGCDLAQGYLFGRPMPASELGVRLAQQETAAKAVGRLG